MKKNITIKIFAFMALFWIIISVVWTWILIFMWGNEVVQEEQVFNQEDLQKLIDSWELQISNSWSITSMWEITWTWEIEIIETEKIWNLIIEK